MCFSCGRQLHSECRNRSGDKCCCSVSVSSVFSADGSTDSVDQETKTRRLKENVTVSAGRKRAAVLYKPDLDKPCEWRNLSNCGGGLYPIVGCIDGYQEHRHHGPDKTTTNNDRSNIHLICPTCHNRWHAKNNGPYKELGAEAPTVFRSKPHNPRPVTAQEIITGEVASDEEAGNSPVLFSD